MKSKVLLRPIIGTIIIICEVLMFVHLDRYNYLHKGISLKTYEILPFYTKIEGDHNSSGYFTFTPIYKNGLELQTNLIFNNKIDSVPTIIYSVPQYIADTVYLSWIKEYGYNEKQLVIKTQTTNDSILWLQPIWKNKQILVTHINKENIDKSAYHWIEPMSGNARVALIVWLLLFILLPISAVCDLYFIICLFTRNRRIYEL